MQYLIYDIDNPALVVVAVNSQGEPLLSNDETRAMTFNEDDAMAFIENVLVPAGADFWGTRPVRKPK